ncbi:hypothetical protein [Paraburkholderia azotifigens]|uniref:TIGR02594 family protein n=1 Tax=Paraburkholderia azotifigens TaxID=2057004 RepID=A0ABU9R357_9BURK
MSHGAKSIIWAEKVFTNDAAISPFGRVSASIKDIEDANKLLAAAPATSPFDVMDYLARIKETGSTGECFNERWDNIANPLIRKIFEDIGYPQKVYAGDCTPWRAATLSWAMMRCKINIPKDPLMARSFAKYGEPTNSPVHGDLVVFASRKGDGSGHVGIFIDKTKENVRVLGANQANIKAKPTNCGDDYPNNKVCINTFPLTDPTSRLRFDSYRTHG